MAQSDIKFKIGDIVVVGGCIGLPATLPAGLHVEQKSQVDQTKDSKVHLLGHPPDWWYDAVWFERSA